MNINFLLCDFFFKSLCMAMILKGDFAVAVGMQT